MANLLIVDDEEKLRALIKRYALFEGHKVAEACDGMQAIEMCKLNNFDVIIMDVMMPELDGFSAVKEIRKFSNTPVIMLSARGEEYDKLHGFELGIDDYVVKPFSSKEIMMRIQAILRRVQFANVSENNHKIFKKEMFEVDLTARKVLIDGKPVEMATKLYDLLFYFIQHKDVAITREQILSDVWKYDYIGDDRTLDTHIKLLRQALGSYASCIVTLRGLGYRFDS